MAKCNVCFRGCEIPEGKRGFCGARGVSEGRVVPLNYGKITSLALDPIEKKPLKRFHPGSYILSAGSYGCNLRCPFCQNHEISWSDEAFEFEKTAEYLSPEELADIALKNKIRGNIGVAFTYNEPLVGFEYILDTAKLVRKMGMVNVLVTNGCAGPEVLDELLPYIDAMNIDLKGFTQKYYSKILGGSLDMVKKFIEKAVTGCHVELTTLVVTGENDSKEEMREISSYIAGLRGMDGVETGPDIPLHITRFFPRFHMTDRPATDVKRLYELADVAREKLRFVYLGNV